MNRAKVERLLLNKVQKTETCWLFTGYRCKEGYGRSWDGTSARLSHRIAFTLWVGEIPPDMTVDHVCYVRNCVNPDHLRLLSHSRNCQLQRKAAKTHCANGHEFTEANTRIRTDRGVRSRECRECNRIACQRYHAKKRLEGTAA